MQQIDRLLEVLPAKAEIEREVPDVTFQSSWKYPAQSGSLNGMFGLPFARLRLLTPAKA